MLKYTNFKIFKNYNNTKIKLDCDNITDKQSGNIVPNAYLLTYSLENEYYYKSPLYELFQDFFNVLNEKQTSNSFGGEYLETVSIFHLRFEGIHPFIDGNGRTGRLILNLELIKSGLLPINIKFADKREYYACFDDYYGANHTSDRLIKLITKYEIEELKNRINLLNNL